MRPIWRWSLQAFATFVINRALNVESNSQSAPGSQRSLFAALKAQIGGEDVIYFLKGQISVDCQTR